MMFSEFVEKNYPEKMLTASTHYDDVCLSHFLKITKPTKANILGFVHYKTSGKDCTENEPELKEAKGVDVRT